MMRLRNLILLLLMGAMCMGGSFTCSTGDDDRDETDRPARTRLMVSFP
jgi:hypothetical protein